MPAINTLLLRLSGPMQSWGSQSRFDLRDTSQEPTKSGVIGLCCAALDRDRDQPIDDLAAARFGVRIDQPGTVMVDYQTAGGDRTSSGYGVAVADGSRPRTVVSQRYYLADAVFLAGLESPDLDLITTIHRALQAPRRQLSLGRKSYIPAEPVALSDGLQPGRGLEHALRDYPLLTRPGRSPHPPTLRLVIEDRDGPEIRHDQPVSRAFRDRTFTPRSVRTSLLTHDPR